MGYNFLSNMAIKVHISNSLEKYIKGEAGSRKKYLRTGVRHEDSVP